jgi:pimeloyl-ACP methyl ester carboxylesterase
MALDYVAVMADGVRIAYRLDGNTDPDAPLVVLSNPSLVDLTFWNEFLSAFFAKPQNTRYRVLRYNNRGRSKHSEDRPLSLDILADDVLALLAKIKVKQAAVVVGISLGGLVGMTLALKHPEAVAAILPCDFYPKSPPNQRQIWGSRVDIARQDKKAPKDSEGIRLVGEDLADITVKRWLAPKSLDGGLEQAKIQALVRMVSTNRLDGFINIVEAISSYNLETNIEEIKVPATFVAGIHDDTMTPLKGLAEKYGGTGVELKIIQDAGHLAVVDQPEEFVDIVMDFLEADRKT